MPSFLRPKDITQEVQEVLVIAMLLGNLVMIVMYLYENCIVWISNIARKVRVKRSSFSMEMAQN